jgi:prevent-host-death family protein
MTEAVISLSDFKAEASRLLREMEDQAGTLILTQNGRARAVVQDYDTYRREKEGILMLKLMVQGESDIQRGRLTDQGTVFAQVRRRLSDNSGRNE